jgi:hypothetical protein
MTRLSGDSTERATVVVLRVFLVALFGVLVVLQTLSFPGQFEYMARESPDEAHLRWPLTIIAVVLIFCVQVVIVATWQLLTRVRRDQIFDEAAFRWVDLIIGAVATAWVVMVGLLVYVGLKADDPGAPMLLFVLTVGVTVVCLLMVVMRALLRRATNLRSDLEAVI